MFLVPIKFLIQRPSWRWSSVHTASDTLNTRTVSGPREVMWAPVFVCPQLATWDSLHGLNGSLKESRIENGMQGVTIKVVTLLVGDAHTGLIPLERRGGSEAVAPDVIVVILRIKFGGVEVEIVRDGFELKDKLIKLKLTQDLIFK